MERKSGPSQFAAANCPGLNTGNTGMDNMPYRRTIFSEKLVRGTDFPLKISVRGGGGGGKIFRTKIAVTVLLAHNALHSA